MKKKIMFIIPSLIGGGAEKVLVDIVNNLSPDKYDLSLVLFEKKGIYLKNIPAYMEVIDLKKKNKFSFFGLVFGLARILKTNKPDNVISFMGYANMIAVLAVRISRLSINLIITIHTHLSVVLRNNFFGHVKLFLYRRLFIFTNYIVVPSKGIADMLVKDFNLNLSNIQTIPHPLLIDQIQKKAREPLENQFRNKYILAVGRLTKAKGYPFLLKAYQIIFNQVDENLLIFGIGEEENNLKQLAKELGIETRVIFAGFQKNPYKFMRNASIFVLSSLWESFAIVLAEAMACGVPVISTDCPSGPGELIDNKENGLLVPLKNEKIIADAMLKLLRDKQMREKFINKGLKKSATLKINKIIPLYEKLLI